jgi:cbb3-type cytochrome oxidase cytochrome c subunit/mono/diheme cytochrome c family protein
MLITPLVAGVGGLLAFFTVVAIVVWLPIHTFDPPPSKDWAPLSNVALKGRNLFAQNGCYVCHSGYSRPQDVRAGLYFLYPKVSQPGDFWGTDQSPNLLGTERTGPDLSQESGWHPNDWQRAHFYDPRYMDPKSLMPDMKAIFSDKQVDELVAFVEERSGKSGLLRYAGQLYAKHVVLANQGFPEAYRGFQGAHNKVVEALPDSKLVPPKNQLEEAPNLSQIDRSYWLSGDPLPVTEANLLRGKIVFLERCVGCHGLKGDGQGPGATFLSPPPADFTDKDDACCGGDTGPGDFYYRILRGWPGTAMENFGDRLSVNDIWRVVLFVKTIPNGTLKPSRVPEPSDYIVWKPSPELLAWVKSHQTLPGNASFKPLVTDPYMQQAMRVFPGLAPGDVLHLNNSGHTTLSLKAAAAGIKAIYLDMLNRAWADAHARGEHLPNEAQKAIPPTVPGQQ